MGSLSQYSVWKGGMIKVSSSGCIIAIKRVLSDNVQILSQLSGGARGVCKLIVNWSRSEFQKLLINSSSTKMITFSGSQYQLHGGPCSQRPPFFIFHFIFASWDLCFLQVVSTNINPHPSLLHFVLLVHDISSILYFLQVNCTNQQSQPWPAFVSTPRLFHFVLLFWNQIFT